MCIHLNSMHIFDLVIVCMIYHVIDHATIYIYIYDHMIIDTIDHVIICTIANLVVVDPNPFDNKTQRYSIAQYK